MFNAEYRLSACLAFATCVFIVACANADKMDANNQGDQGGDGQASGGETQSSSGGSAGSTATWEPGGTGGSSTNQGTGGKGSDTKVQGVGGTNAGGTTGSTVLPGQGGAPITATKCAAPICDDFESYTVASRPGGPWSDFEVSAAGSLAVDNTRAYSGTKSMKFSMRPANDMTARMRHNGSGFVPGKEVFMRAMMYLEEPITGQGVFHWNFMRAEGTSYSIVAGGNAAGKTFQNFGGNGRDCYVHGGKPLPTGEWVCVEYHVNGQANVAEMMWNGVVDEFTQVSAGNAIPGFSGCLSPPGNNWDIPEPATVRFGFTMLHELDASVTMWLDDIVVSNRLVGCPAQK